MEAGVALVTGGAVRLGAAFSRHLVARGYNLALHYFSSATQAHVLATELREGGATVSTLCADLRNSDAIPTLVDQIHQELGEVSLMVHNAGSLVRGGLESADHSTWQRAFQLHVEGPALLTRALAPDLRRQGGQVIFVGDLAGEQGWPSHLTHSVTRGAALILMRMLALELAPSVRVAAISPGILDFDPLPPAARHIPLRRVGSSSDVMRALDYVLDARFVTGEILHVDGGRLARRT